MKTKRLTSCGNAAEAHIIKGALESEGIACILHNENNLWGGIAAVGCAGVDLFVYEDEYERAKQLLESTSETISEEEDVR